MGRCRVCRDSGIALVRVFEIVWEVSEVRGCEPRFGEREQRETWDMLKKAIDLNRAGSRQLFS